MGRAAFCCSTIGDEFVLSDKRLITTLACSLSQKLEYALEGSIFVGGAVVQWLRDGLKAIQSSADVEKLALSAEDSGGVVFVPAFVGLGAPHWDPYARGLIIGLERGTTAGHIARAALESIAFQVADVLRAMDTDAAAPFRELRVDGGASANDTLMQFQADLLGIQVVRPAVLETTALGAAYLAGLAVGFWQSPEEIWKQRAQPTLFEPKGDKRTMDAMRGRWEEAVKRAGGWLKA